MVMHAREHHGFFARRLIPSHSFQSADKMFAELTGAKREAFLMWLWNEAGSTAHPKLPHVAVANGQLSKLEVIGALKKGDQQVVVLSMPPALEPGEAVFIALVRKAGVVRVFFLERGMDAAGTGAHPTAAALAELRADDTRVDHGLAPGLDLAAFKRRLGELLGMSLDGIERSLPEITMAAFQGRATAGGAASAGAPGKPVGVGPLLATLLLIRAGLPLVFALLAGFAGAAAYSIWTVLTTVVYPLFALLIAVLLLVWVYQVHAARRAHSSLSPGVALLCMLLPGLNLLLLPVVLRSAWRATVGVGGWPLVLGWWVLWLLEIVRSLVQTPQAAISSVDGGAFAFNFAGTSMSVPRGVGGVVLAVLSWGLLVTVLAWGLLWYIVKRVNERT